MAAPRASPTGDLAHNPGMCPDWELNQQPFGLQANDQSTEPYHPGLEYVLMQCIFLLCFVSPKLLYYSYIFFLLDVFSNQLVKFYLTNAVKTLVGILLIT